MEFIEELIRKTLPGIEKSVRNISDSIIDDYWAEVCTSENLKEYLEFDMSWEEWFFEYQAHMDDIAEHYYKKTKEKLIWTLYDKRDVANCLLENFLEPILFKNGCHGSWHPDVQAAFLSYQNEE